MADFSKLNRRTVNGYETTLAIHTLAPGNWRWELIRYPEDPDRWQEPTETVFILPRSWDFAFNIVAQYLADNPDDGFAAF